MSIMENRESQIVKTSIIGIVTNIVLSGFKVAVGIVSNSIAIILDAVNNLSDAASSIITIVGAKLAGKKPDIKHPYGYGRLEYLSALVISMIVLYAGITSLRESILKIIHPEETNYTLPTLIIVAVAVVVKIILGTYVKSVGEKINSDSLINSGEDARLDSVISASTLIAAIIYIFTHISLEAYLGAIISLVIIKSGIGMARDTLSKILGESADAKLVKEIKSEIKKFNEVKGAYDLILNDYGPDTHTASVHIEVLDNLDANDIDKLTREITEQVHKNCKVALTAIGIYSINTKDEEIRKMREEVTRIILSHDFVLQTHGFYYDKDAKAMRFDVVISLKAKNREKIYSEIINEIQEKYNDVKINATLDTDFTEKKD
ncbi:MAG: cation transporter [Lachnospiraceae bacterium]|nr:cation transporter [Lachnospiraceae bacterium]